ncbi:alpha-1,3-mannosyl-glycoprotein 4-beta-N-acetylglucosaminyltransferase A-like [Urocitellus parryii]
MKPLLLKIHVNPPAEVSTSLKVYQGHTLEKTYMGEDFFWAITPIAGDYILFKFDKPVNVESYLFHSGNQEHPGDILLNTTVEVLPLKREGLEISKETKDKRLEDGYFRIETYEDFDTRILEVRNVFNMTAKEGRKRSVRVLVAVGNGQGAAGPLSLRGARDSRHFTSLSHALQTQCYISPSSSWSGQQCRPYSFFTKSTS